MAEVVSGAWVFVQRGTGLRESRCPERRTDVPWCARDAKPPDGDDTRAGSYPSRPSFTRTVLVTESCTHRGFLDVGGPDGYDQVHLDAWVCERHRVEDAVSDDLLGSGSGPPPQRQSAHCAVGLDFPAGATMAMNRHVVVHESTIWAIEIAVEFANRPGRVAHNRGAVVAVWQHRTTDGDLCADTGAGVGGCRGLPAGVRPHGTRCWFCLGTTGRLPAAKFGAIPDVDVGAAGSPNPTNGPDHSQPVWAIVVTRDLRTGAILFEQNIDGGNQPADDTQSCTRGRGPVSNAGHGVSGPRQRIARASHPTPTARWRLSRPTRPGLDWLRVVFTALRRQGATPLLSPTVRTIGQVQEITWRPTRCSTRATPMASQNYGRPASLPRRLVSALHRWGRSCPGGHGRNRDVGATVCNDARDGRRRRRAQSPSAAAINPKVMWRFSPVMDAVFPRIIATMQRRAAGIRRTHGA